MGGVAVRFRAEFRRRWRAWLALAVLVGLPGGVVLGTLAAARRADRAYDRFLAASNPFDVAVQGVPDPSAYDGIVALPEVAESGRLAFVFLDELDGDVRPVSESLAPLANLEKGPFTELNRSKVIEGRFPDPDQPLEISMTPLAAESRDAGVGDTLRVATYSVEQIGALFSGESATVTPEGPPLELEVVGITVAPTEFLRSGNGFTIHLSSAFAREYGGRVAMVEAVAVRLERGAADVAGFKEDVDRLLGGAQPGYITQTEDADRVRSSIHLQAIALQVFAVIAALVAIVVSGQALARHGTTESGDDGTLAALGVAPNQLTALAAARSTAIAVGGALLAVLIALALSPVLLFGLAKQAEPKQGLRVDGVVLGVGAVAVAVVAVATTVVPAWLTRRRSVATRPSEPRRTSRTVAAVAHAGGSPAAVAGVRMALETGHGRTAVPVRTGVFGAIVSVAAFVLALSFGASLDHLRATPRLYGWDWDALYGNPYSEDVSERVVPVLRDEPDVVAFSSVSFAQLAVEGVRSQALAFDPIEGAVRPPVVEGRPPLSADEVALGASTLDDVDADIGDVVTLSAGDRAHEVHVVGRAVLPGIGQYDLEGLGEGVLMTQDGLERLADAPRNLFAVAFAAGSDIGEVAGAIGDRAGIDLTSFAVAPEEVADFGRVDRMPTVLATIVALVGVATFAHLLVVAAQRRRRDLAMLKVLGFVRSDVQRTVAWQATTLAGIALAIGLPLGAVAGRVVWDLFADRLGVVPEPVIPPAVALLVPIGFVIGNALAALPGVVAARAPVPESLRSE